MAFLETSVLEAEIDIIEQQQHFCDLFGHPSSIIYDCYTTKESLAQKIDLILPHKNEIERNELTATIWSQNGYNGGNCLFMSPIYVTLVLDHKPKVQSKILSKTFQVHPVFRVQMCKSLPGESGGNCCAVFIDESGRVYMNWTAFRADNVYDDGLVVAPLNGIYNVSPDNKVKLELFERKAGITKSLDRSSMVIGLASAGIAALTFIPVLTVGPVVVVGAATAGLSCAVYTGIRGIYNLYDRKKHKQTIRFTNPEARSSWINVAAGAFSASAASATQLLAKAAHSSTGMTNIIRSSAHALSAGALGLHTTGCVEDIYLLITKMHEFESMSPMEISHLSTLLYLLTHSVKNQRTAEKMLSLSQACEAFALKEILRNSQKLAINGLVHETMKIQGCAAETNNIGQVTVRSLKNRIDSQPILMELDNEEQGGSEKMNVTKETIKSEYLKIFESRIASIVSHVFAKFKTRSENELEIFMINVMQVVSIHLFDDFMALVETMIDKYGTMAEARSQNVITFEHLAIMILKQLNVIGKDSNVTDLKEYLTGLTETERSKIDEHIRDYFDHLKDEHVQHADELLASHIDISDDEKIAIAIDGEVEKVCQKFEALGIIYMKDDLRETVKDVLLSMPLAAAHIFFSIVTKFTIKNATQIQSRLGRFIPVDIFMTDIHSLLKKVSINCGQELEHYLVDYSESVFEGIEKEICQFYDSQLGVAGDLDKCSHCAGVHYNLK